MKNQLTTFYIVRHGETDWNREKRLQGQTDIPLNAKGEIQAKEIAESLRHIHFDEVISSDLLRAKRTAEIIALERKMIVKTTEAIREKIFGSLEGHVWKNVSSLFSAWKSLSNEERWHYTIADEESNEQLVQRFLLFLRETAIAYSGKTVLVVCHGGLMRMLLIKLGYGNFDEIGWFENCGYVQIDSDGVEFFIKNVVGLHPLGEDEQ